MAATSLAEDCRTGRPLWLLLLGAVALRLSQHVIESEDKRMAEEIHWGLLNAINQGRQSKFKRELSLREAQAAENFRHKTGLWGEKHNPFAQQTNALNYLIETYP